MNKYVKIVNESLKSFNKFETLLLLSILSLTIANFVIKGEVTLNSAIAAIGAILGVFCVVLGAKGSMANWIFGTIEAFLHIYIFFRCSSWDGRNGRSVFATMVRRQYTPDI